MLHFSCFGFAFDWLDLLVCWRVFSLSYRVLPDLTEFFQSFSGFQWIFLVFSVYFASYIGFYLVSLGFTWFYWVLLGSTGFYRVFTGLEWVLLLNEVLNCYLWIQTFNPVKTFGRDGGGHFVFNPEIPRKPNSMKINSSNRFWFSIESKTRSNRGVFVKDFWYQCTQCECRDEMKTLFSPGNPRKPHETKIHLSNGSKFPMAKKNSRKPTETWQRSFNSLIRRFQVSSVYFIDSFNLLTDGPL